MSHADRIIEQLRKNNIIIQRYDAITTNSTYLKLDYGVLNSIRISDHHGKPKLNYRYNLLSNISKTRYDRSTKRFYFPKKQVNQLIKQILSDQNDKRTRYGDEYESYMQNNIKDNGHKKGFWSESRIV